MITLMGARPSFPDFGRLGIDMLTGEGQVAKFNRLWFKVSGGCSADQNSSHKENEYMYINYSGCSNTSLTNINTHNISTTVTALSSTTSASTISTPVVDIIQGQMGQKLCSWPLTEAHVSLLARGFNLYCGVMVISKRRVCCSYRKCVSSTQNGSRVKETNRALKHVLSLA